MSDEQVWKKPQDYCFEQNFENLGTSSGNFKYPMWTHTQKIHELFENKL